MLQLKIIRFKFTLHFFNVKFQIEPKLDFLHNGAWAKDLKTYSPSPY